MRKPDDTYLEKAKKLSVEQVERLHSRMRNKLTRKTDGKKLSVLEALAIQLELEDEQLEEWREQRLKLNEKHKNADEKNAAAKTEKSTEKSKDKT